MGDAELDEGNIYEALIEGAKHDVRNCWWIVDYNRQSLDATSADRMFERFDEIFRAAAGASSSCATASRCRPRSTPTPALKSLVRAAAQRRSVGAPLSGRRGVARAARSASSARPAARSSTRTTTRRCGAVHRPRRPLHGEPGRGVRRRAGRRPDPVHRLDDQGLRPALRRPQGQSCRADEPDPDRGACATAMGVREGHEWEPLEGVGDNARPGVEALIEPRPHRARQASAQLRHDRGPGDPRARRRRAIDPGRVRPNPARPSKPGGRPRRPHRHHLARRHRLDQPRRLGQPARPVPPQRSRRRVRRGKDCVGAKMGRQQQRPAYRARHRREQSVPDARRRGPRRRPVRHAAVPDRHRSTTRSLPAASMRLNYACYQDARFLLVATPSGVTLGPEGGAHQSINPPLDRARPAGPAPLRAGLRRRARGDDGGSLPADRRSGRRKHLSAPVDARRSRRSSATTMSWRDGALAGGYWLREPGAERRSGDRRDGRGHARSARRLGGAWRRRARPRPARDHLARPAPPRLDGGAGGALAGASASRATSSSLLSRLAPRRRPRHPCRRRPRLAVLARRRSRASASRRSASRSSARPAASPTSTPAYRLDGAAITEAAAEILLQNGL